MGSGLQSPLSFVEGGLRDKNLHTNRTVFASQRTGVLIEPMGAGLGQLVHVVGVLRWAAQAWVPLSFACCCVESLSLFVGASHRQGPSVNYSLQLPWEGIRNRKAADPGCSLKPMSAQGPCSRCHECPLPPASCQLSAPRCPAMLVLTSTPWGGSWSLHGADGEVVAADDSLGAGVEAPQRCIAAAVSPEGWPSFWRRGSRRALLLGPCCYSVPWDPVKAEPGQGPSESPQREQVLVSAQE